ncbi:MAG TPA: hypothetical protein VEY91_12835 [Candidatus Limnocylindria bacterium]|nr:hypothetical protein [Candidatus Limnocylindria bacterium]
MPDEEANPEPQSFDAERRQLAQGWRGARRVKVLIGVAVAALVVVVLLQVAAMGGAAYFHGQKRYDDEIAWLEGLQPALVWERGIDRELDKRYRERLAAALQTGRLDRAVHAFRQARARTHALGVKPDRELTALGIETLTRSADRVERHGRLSAAADWDDSLFVFAIRAEEPHHRYAALAAFIEGLDLRLRDGKPCAALARVEWAKRGLGGEVPGLQANIEEDLRVQCEVSRRRGRSR